jgi:group I intron endonuclease
MAVIYRITNMINGKYYVGSAESFERRKWQHTYDLKRGAHKNPRLQAAWNKYGADVFVFEVLETVPEGESTFSWENKWLHKCVGQPDCYNVNTDAFVPRLGVRLSEASKAQLSKNRKGKHAGEAHYRFGQTVSPEVRAKISAAQKGRANPRKGKQMSEQGRANVAAAAKRGEESHFHGKRPKNAEALQRQVYVIKADGSQAVYPSLTVLRDAFGVSIATTVRACKTKQLVKKGVASGWRMSYEPLEPVVIPEEYAHLPKTRTLAKQQGVAQYFTGTPCERGHVGPRAVKGECILCRRESEKRARKVGVATP